MSGRRIATLAAVALASCAATGVTLRSNHYRVAVPPGWQVIEAGGDSGIPTLIRVPPPGGGAPGVELRLYPWLAQGPIADPSADAFQRLRTAGILDLAAAGADEQLCDGVSTFTVFGESARAIRVRNSAGQRIVVAAGHASGSLVAIVGIVAAGSLACTDVEALDSSVKRLAALVVDSGDATRPVQPSTILPDPGRRGLIELPPADPGRPLR